MPTPKIPRTETSLLLCFIVSAAGYVSLSEVPAVALEQVCFWCVCMLSARRLAKPG